MTAPERIWATGTHTHSGSWNDVEQPKALALTQVEYIRADLIPAALAVPEVRAQTVGEAALEHMLDRRGISGVLEQIRDEDPEIWKEICEETGRAALAALRGEGGNG